MFQTDSDDGEPEMVADCPELAACCAQLGLCVRCYLRVIGERRPAAYNGAEAAVRAARHFYGHDVGDAVCPACLGALQDAVLDRIPQLAAPILRKITHTGWYKVNVSLPASAALVRERAFAIVLRRVVPSAERPIALREAFKLALDGRLQKSGLTYSAQASLFLDVSLAHPDSVAECAFVESEDAPSNWKRKRPRLKWDENAAASTTVVTRVVGDMSDARFEAAVGSSFLPPPTPETPVTVEVVVSTASIFLAGEYNKLSRVVSQTPWRVTAKGDDDDAPPQYTHSVESIVCAGLDALFAPERVTFTAGGREDVDVRMLGGGRPFVVEIVNPSIVPGRVTDGMLREALAASACMSTAVLVNNLRFVPKEHFADMRVYESEKRKRYRCIVWTDRPVAEAELKRVLEKTGGFLLKQRTPLRVLHRRNLAVRERAVLEATVRRVMSPQFFVLDLTTAAGTYVKEFVHGDSGRTLPNVGQLLGCRADILQLDVLGVQSKNPANGKVS